MMEKNKQVVPLIRFKEFEGSWSNNKIRDFYTNLRTGMTPYRGKPEYYTGDIPWITSGELNYNHIEKTNETISESAVKETNLKLYPSGTFFIAITGLEAPGTRGKCAINAVPATTNQSCMAFEKNDNVNTLFLYFWYNKFGIPLYYRFAQGTKQQSFNNRIVEDFTISLPTLPEQQKIAAFLTAVDDKIQQLTRKKALLEQYKKGMMQQLFKQELRFKDEQGNDYPDWEEKKLGEIFSRVTRKNSENNKNVLTISAQQGLVNQEEYFNKSVSAKDVTGYYLLKKGEFAYNKSYSKGYPMGATKRLNQYDKGVVSTLYICFKIKDGSSPVFYEQYFESGFINKELHKIAQEGARNHGLLNMSVVEYFNDVKIPYPSLPEQQKIASFLSSIDQKIEQVGVQLDKAKEWKKGLLQKMFV